MADLKSDLAECVRLVASEEPFGTDAVVALHNLFHDHGDELLAMVEDARRYRWLREKTSDDYGSCRIYFTWTCPTFNVGTHPPRDNAKVALDAAIDAAMSVVAGNGGGDE